MENHSRMFFSAPHVSRRLWENSLKRHKGRDVESKSYERRATFGPAWRWDGETWKMATEFRFTKDENPNMEVNCRYNPRYGFFSLATGGDIFCRVAVGCEADHVVCLIITEAHRLNARAPLGNLTPTFIITVAAGVTLCIRHCGGLIAAGAVYRGGGITGGIRHADTAPGKVGHRGGGVAPAIRLRADDTAGVVLARGAWGATTTLQNRAKNGLTSGDIE